MPTQLTTADLYSVEYISEEYVGRDMTSWLTLFEQLVRAQTRLWNQLDRELAAENVPLGWFAALRVVAQTPGCRVHDVARVLDISPGGASKLVDRLVAAKLVDRSVDSNDRRASLLVLTKEGRSRLRRGEALAEVWLGEALPGLDAARRDELATWFATLGRRAAIAAVS